MENYKIIVPPLLLDRQNTHFNINIHIIEYFCITEASVNESCFFNEQCEALNFQTNCQDGRCTCRFEMTPVTNKDGTIECKGMFSFAPPSCPVLVFVRFYTWRTKTSTRTRPNSDKYNLLTSF